MPRTNLEAGRQYQRTYYATHRAAALLAAKIYYATYVRQAPRVAGAIPDAVIQDALTGIPERWREPDTLGAGAYLWHCGAWQKIEDIPMACKGCGTVFFEEPPR
jgi:hypothetical protein